MDSLHRDALLFEEYVQSLPRLAHTRRLHGLVERLNQLRSFPECTRLEDMVNRTRAA